ncbi:MAG: hypothetical protein KJ964_10190 [Verrucomicrobia bacterium]|nr:hypothetical protein [Verrucomicrobiota bacterium]MBU1735803.1 hypothetical protein [Verrucomicrobiota bacterium]MBU1858104.1 hypothetical protein [Verrucomicrobiota bacterium]
MKCKSDYATLTVRPYQLLCIVCSLGESDSAQSDPRLKEISERIRANPDMPIALRCNAADEFSYQAVGPRNDTREGMEFNRKRDMDILQRLDLAPGSILPARIILGRLLKAISSVSGICGYATVTSEAWRGCPQARSGRYEKGHTQGINAIIPPRSTEEMKRDKDKSIEDMFTSKAIKIRPHILVCAVAQYGEGVRPPFAPDNLPEMIQHILKHPDTPITLVSGADWMMCGPCPNRVHKLNACVCGNIGSGGLYNEMKDLNVLQVLGLTYGTTMDARSLYKLIFERIPKTGGVCALDSRIAPLSVWRDGCGASPAPCPNYAKGREMLMKELVQA